MWASKAGLGSQLSFGVRGNGLVSVDPDDLEPHLEFPRASDEGVMLHRIRKSYKEVKPSQTTVVISGLGSLNQGYIPAKIIKSYSIESKTIESEIRYDPTYGQMMAFFDVRAKNGPVSATAVAFVNGAAANVVEIGVLSYEPSKLKGVGVEDSQVLVPKFPETPLQISFPGAVKQIEYCRIRDNFDTISQYLAVRTSRTIHILKCYQLGSKSSIKSIQIAEISASQLHGYDWADVCFNPHLYHQLAAVDVNGNFGVWEINSRDNLTKMMQLSMNDPSNDLLHLSNWKKAAWGSNSDRLLLFSRVEAVEFQLTSTETSTSRAIITANTWSRIRDFKVVSNSMNYAFLLTSKELIWVELSDPIQRIMTWKHFLDDSDPSMKLDVCEYDDRKFICSVYSQTNQLVFVYNFGFIDDQPYCLRDPYFIEQTLADTPILQVSLHEMNSNFYSTIREDGPEESNESTARSFGLFEVHQDLSFNFSIYSTEPGLSFLSSLDKSNLLNSIERTPTHKTKFFHLLSKKDVLPIVEAMRGILKSPGIEDDVKLIQNYAYEIGKWASGNDNEQNCSLLDISSDIPLVSDLGEIDSMLEQLSEYFDLKDIKLQSYYHRLAEMAVFRRKIRLIEAIDEELSVFNQSKLASFNQPDSLKKLAIILGASLNKITIPSDQHSSEFQEESKDAPSEIQEILAGWDDEMIEDNTQTTVADMPSSFPMINISQEKSSRRPRRSEVRRTLHSSRTRYPPFRPSLLSQTIGSSQDIAPPSAPTSQVSPPSSQIASSQLHHPFSSQLDHPSSSQLPNHPSSSQRLHSQQTYPSSQTRPSQRSGQRKKRKKGGFA